MGSLQNTAVLSVTTAAPAITQFFTNQVSGTGINTVDTVAIAPVSIGFGDVKLGSQASVPVRFTNQSAVTVNLAGGGISQSDAFTSAFGGGSGCTSSTIASGATCSDIYSYRPPTLGEHSASTSRSFTRPGVTQFQEYHFSGTGVGELAQVSPVEFDLGEVAIGTFATLPVTIFNDGDLPLTGFVGGGVSAPFSQSNNCTGSIAPGASCTFTYRFDANPFNVGPHEALTLISFTNINGVQPTKEVRMRATAIDRLFRDGFE